MISWRDQGIIIDYRRHGETGAIIEIFSLEHGRHMGVVRGGASRKNAPVLQAGNVVEVEFSARLEEHLGSFKVEPIQSFVASFMSDPLRLAIFQSISSLIKFGMTERDPHPLLYQSTLAWLTSHTPDFDYVHWELTLLSEAGFHLELDKCAVTGYTENLEFVSPKTGRAVTLEAAGQWADQLLPYSPIFAGHKGELEPALKTTGYFLSHWLASMIGKHELPKARGRAIELLERR